MLAIYHIQNCVLNYQNFFFVWENGKEFIINKAESLCQELQSSLHYLLWMSSNQT